LTSRFAIRIRFAASMCDGSKQRPYPGESRQESLLNVGIAGFVGLLIFATGPYLRVSVADADSPRRGKGSRPASAPVKPGQAKPVTSTANAGPPKPTRTPLGQTTVEFYRAECLKCHDHDGKGELVRDVMPEIPDFTDADWQDSRTVADLRRSILEGKGKSMPPTKAILGSGHVSELISFIRAFRAGAQIVPEEPELLPRGDQTTSVANSRATKPQGPPERSEAALRLQNGSRLFQRLCTKCHGANGDGSEMRARALAVPNFTDPTWHAKRSDPQLLASILDGKGTRMPAFRGRVSEKDARELIAYVRAACRTQPRPAASTPSDFEKRFRQLEQQFDDLQKEIPK
jgi:mono/diheme cytochrome c family protein